MRANTQSLQESRPPWSHIKFAIAIGRYGLSAEGNGPKGQGPKEAQEPRLKSVSQSFSFYPGCKRRKIFINRINEKVLFCFRACHGLSERFESIEVWAWGSELEIWRFERKCIGQKQCLEFSSCQQSGAWLVDSEARYWGKDDIPMCKKKQPDVGGLFHLGPEI